MVSWVMLGLGAVTDAYNVFLLVHKLITSRFASAVWLVPLIFYGLSIAMRSAGDLPVPWGFTGALALLHIALLSAHVLTGRRVGPENG